MAPFGFGSVINTLNQATLEEPCPPVLPLIGIQTSVPAVDPEEACELVQLFGFSQSKSPGRTLS